MLDQEPTHHAEIGCALQMVRDSPLAARGLLEERPALQKPMMLVVEPGRRCLLRLMMVADDSGLRPQQVG